MKRNIYLSATELDTIKDILDQVLSDCKYKYKKETILVKDALHRINTNSVFALVSSPSYNASAMDGVAVKSFDTYYATDTSPVNLSKDQYEYINTGNMLPHHFDAVIMIEDIIENQDNTITIIKSCRAYENVRPIGEDITKGDLVIPAFHKIKPIDISALLAAGIKDIEVVTPITIGVLPTGDEIVSEMNDMKMGTILDSNSAYIKNELALLGIEADVLPVQKDVFDTLERIVIDSANQYDILLIGAGSSAGSKDYVKAIIEKNGKVYVHGINMKPGKPSVIGTINHTPVIGLPGYPVSTYIAFEQIVKPLIHKMMFSKKENNVMIKAKLVKRVYSSLKNHEFIRIALGKIGGDIVAIPLDRKAGVTMSLVKAHGLLKIPKNSEGFNAGEIVEVELTSKEHNPEETLVVIGSHDILFDIMHEELLKENINLISSHVGSFGGIQAIKNNECHIAPTHLLGENGVYNDFVLDKYLSEEFVLVKGLERTQGLYVKKGNPKNISSIMDVTKVSFVNRQRGSGTRVLLDYLLENNNIDKNNIVGYGFELSTHILVAESIKDSRFDTGLGVESVSNLADVDFIRVGEESYDFIVRKEFINDSKFITFMKVLQSKQVRDRLKELGGYQYLNTGRVIKK